MPLASSRCFRDDCRKAHRYDETKPLADQFPFVKTVNPEVRMIMTHITKAAGVEYTFKRQPIVLDTVSMLKLAHLSIRYAKAVGTEASPDISSPVSSADD